MNNTVFYSCLSLFESMDQLHIKGVTKRYHGKPAVEDLEFKVNKGQIIGLLGPNGAGKTTTMSIITGVFAADEGEVLFDGERMTSENEIALKEKIGFLSEANPLYPEMLVKEYLEYMAGLRGLDKSQTRDAIKKVIKETGIEERLYQPIEELSKGYKQRVGLAQAILHEPDLLILDEPTEGLDPNQRVMIRDLIANLGKERTVMISTHVLSEVQAMCDHVVILNEGKVITQGTVDEVISQGKKGQKVHVEAKGNSVKEKLIEKGWTVQDGKEIEGVTSVSVVSSGEGDIRSEIFNLAKANNWELLELHQESKSLEDTFRQLTNK
jgi:ABC-2 type transport system ATP-binding protein